MKFFDIISWKNPDIFHSTILDIRCYVLWEKLFAALKLFSFCKVKQIYKIDRNFWIQLVQNFLGENICLTSLKILQKFKFYKILLKFLIF